MAVGDEDWDWLGDEFWEVTETGAGAGGWV